MRVRKSSRWSICWRVTRELRREDLLVAHLAEPVAVVDDLGLVAVEDLEGLVGVGLGVGEHLVAGERRAGGGAAGGIADGGGEVADEQHGLVAEQLELAELLQRDGVAEVDVRRGGIDAELDAQRAAEAEFFEQFLFGEDLGGAGGEEFELGIGGHGGKRKSDAGKRQGRRCIGKVAGEKQTR